MKLKNVLDHAGVVLYNFVVTQVPSHNVRVGFLRAFGAEIGADSAVFRGTTVLGIRQLKIGEACVVSFRCLLDARGGLTIGNNVVIASDTQFITAHHEPNSDDFAAVTTPTVIEDSVWIASRSTILGGITVGKGAVVGACSLVRKSVEAMDIVAGVPAEVRGQRTSSLDYRPKYRPLFF
ncbi:acyltransferase [Arthrobacter cavernae]|uniref:Acyltransferase n=1 Tax=Arthrobacter cavernae TaxID=2817681 RepID=A0A939KNL1_9MICC|nr:acyltransferase [Arthrobacter cavernae]MBO1267705.1 acyltransferase [Arthrobacter cavernae]